MSRNALGPHVPKPGYRKRWARQALALIYRTPFALVVLAVFGVIAMMPGYLVGGVALEMTPDTLFLNPGDLVRLVAVPFLTPVMMLTIALFMREDLRISLSDIHLWSAIGPAVAVTTLINTLVILVIALLPDSQSAAEFASDTPGSTSMAQVALLLLQGLCLILPSAFVAHAIVSPLFLAGLVGAALSVRELRELDRIFMMRQRRLHFEIYITIFALALFSVFLGPLAVIVHLYILAWHYVAVREIIGGISENKEHVRETQAREHTAHAS